MQDRNLVYRALALRVRESPKGDRILCLMTAEAGLVDAFVFGGPKSKLRSLATPYSCGRAFIYHDPVRDFNKLSDFDVQDSFSGLREDLRKIWVAGLVAEFLQRTSGGGGDFPLVLDLAVETLLSLEALPSDKADYPALLFLWRMLGILGLMPDPASCSSCGCDLDSQSPHAYSPHAGGFLCPACARSEAGSLQAYGEAESYALSAGALRWLERSEGQGFAAAARTGLDSASLAGLKALVFHLARKAAEGPLASLQAAMGII